MTKYIKWRKMKIQKVKKNRYQIKMKALKTKEKKINKNSNKRKGKRKIQKNKV